MSLLVPWVAFPMLLTALSAGCGLLVERAAGRPLPRGLLLPAGVATVMVAALFPPVLHVAWLATPLVVALAVAGVALSFPRRFDYRPWAWPVAAALATFAVFAAPVVLSGAATFAGYIKLDDTATYLAMLDRFTSHGYGTSGLQPSTYEATLNTSLVYGYPMGSLVPLGVGRDLVREDTLWLWQPYLAFLGAMLCLGLYALLKPLVPRRPVRAAVAFVAAQPAVLYGYVMWGGIKEISAAALLALLAALVPPILREPGIRAMVPAGVPVAAIVGVLSVAGAVWLAPLALAFVVVAVASAGLRRAGVMIGAAAAVGAVLAVPSFYAASKWLHHTGAFTSDTEFGNLPHALSKLQIFGTWPVGDFRDTPGHLTATHILVALVAVLGLLGLALAIRARAWGIVAFAAAAVGGTAVFVGFSSPWIEGKSLATASPAFLAAALVPVGVQLSGHRRLQVGDLVAGLAGLAIAVGVGWSNVLAYHEVTLAPHDRLAELDTIGKRFAGASPALMTEFESYGVRLLLRRLDPEGASELRRRFDYLRAGQPLETGASADIDELQLGDVLFYRTLVLRRSPAMSRPPSVYSRVWQGPYYEVWQRPETYPQILEHLSLGNRLNVAAVPKCADVLRLARLVGSTGHLVAVPRLDDVALDLPTTIGFASGGGYGEQVTARYLTGATSWTHSVAVPTVGAYDVGIAGSFRGRLDLELDGEHVASARHRLNWPGQYEPLASLQLTPGQHELRFVYHGSDLHPGSAGVQPFGAGPVVVGPAGQGEPALLTVQPSEAQSLCGRSLDWVEASG